MLRIILFLATNLAVMVLLTIVVKVTGLDVYAYNNGGLNLQGLLIMAAVLGMGGSFISLAMSKWIAKRSIGAQVITQPRNATETLAARHRAPPGREGRHRHARSRDLRSARDERVRDRHEQEQRAGRASARACSTAWIAQRSTRCSATRSAHVANGDMVTMALMQGVLNTFVIFLSRVVGTLVDRAISGNARAAAAFGVFRAS